MKRLTEKDYCGYDIKDRKAFSGYGAMEDSKKIFNCLQKLGQLEDIEDKIGVRLSALFEQPYCTIFVRKDYGKNYKNVIEEHTLYSIIPQEKCIIVTFETIKFYFKDYGKTWALTREELK